MKYYNTPQLKKIHSGKVRDSFRIDDKRRLIVVSDRVSAFDKVLKTSLKNKGAILNGVAAAWLEKTRHIIDNHLIEVVDANASIVKEVKPIRVEVIVRKYLTGSIWRKYEKGVREVCGVKLPEGMKKNDSFPTPIVTPTTKDITDTDITPDAIVEYGLAEKATYKEMERVALELFDFGTELCASKDLILVDSKYEFGIDNGKLILIDEIHTPDSSRFWPTEAYAKDQNSEQWFDKEFIRQWILVQDEPKAVKELTVEVQKEAEERYAGLYEMLIGEAAPNYDGVVERRLHNSLCKAGLVKDAYVAIIVASKRDLDHGKKLLKALEGYNVMIDLRAVSAHKNGEDIPGIVEVYNASAEPGAVIAVAGRSNGLGGALSANLALPVINCPPFKDKVDMLVNINSSLVMPSQAPAATTIDPENAAKMALRCLNLTRLKALFMQEMQDVKEALQNEDRELQELIRKDCSAEALS
jgi:fusion protein PurCD